MNGVIQTGLMAFPELAEELADSCPAIAIEAIDWQNTFRREPIAALAIAKIVIGIHVGCHRTGIPLCETISELLTQPIDSVNRRFKELENDPLLQQSLACAPAAE